MSHSGRGTRKSESFVECILLSSTQSWSAPNEEKHLSTELVHFQSFKNAPYIDVGCVRGREGGRERAFNHKNGIARDMK